MEENDDKSALISPVNTAIATQLGNPTFKALSYLISSVLDIPAAWLDQQAQRIKDKTAARSEVTQALAAITAVEAAVPSESKTADELRRWSDELSDRKQTHCI